MTQSYIENRPKLTYGKSANTAHLTPEISSKIDGINNLSSCDRNKAIHLCELLIKKFERHNLSANDFVDVPANYLREIFGGNYHKWLKTKIDNGLLRVQTWLNEKGEEVQYEHKYNAYCNSN